MTSSLIPTHLHTAILVSDCVRRGETNSGDAVISVLSHLLILLETFFLFDSDHIKWRKQIVLMCNNCNHIIHLKCWLNCKVNNERIDSEPEDENLFHAFWDFKNEKKMLTWK